MNDSNNNPYKSPDESDPSQPPPPNRIPWAKRTAMPKTVVEWIVVLILILAAAAMVFPGTEDRVIAPVPLPPTR